MSQQQQINRAKPDAPPPVVVVLHARDPGYHAELARQETNALLGLTRCVRDLTGCDYLAEGDPPLVLTLHPWEGDAVEVATLPRACGWVWAEVARSPPVTLGGALFRALEVRLAK